MRQIPKSSFFRTSVRSFFRFASETSEKRCQASSYTRMPNIATRILPAKCDAGYRQTGESIPDSLERLYRGQEEKSRRKTLGSAVQRNSKRKLVTFLFPSFNCVSVTSDFSLLATGFAPKIFLIYFKGFYYYALYIVNFLSHYSAINE